MARFSFQAFPTVQSVLRAVIPLPAAYRARLQARERRAMRFEGFDAFDLLDAEPGDTLDDGPPAGPGWYTSSWELTRGLDVREGLPADAKLHEWLEVCLMA